MPMPIFDIDDMSFFRALGLGLRHVELALGLEEKARGNKKGDAVSLAAYGVDPDKEDIAPSLFTIDTCDSFQRKVEKFILDSYGYYHQPRHHYRDAAFILLVRGDDARSPYDFRSYPLGKCGTRNFSANQVMLMVTSDQYHNEDINHAVCNTLYDLKNRIKELKIAKAQELLEKLTSQNISFSESQQIELKHTINTLMSYYQQDIFIISDLFLQVHSLFESRTFNYSYFKAVRKINSIEKKLEQINDALKNINPEIKKGNKTLSVTYEPEDFDALTVDELKEKLIHYVINQNKEKVVACIKRLPPNVFSNTEKSPLQMAALRPDTAILKAVYEYDPTQYDNLLRNPNAASPIWHAAYKLNFENLKFLLSVRTLQKRDFSFYNSDHILSHPAESETDESYHIIQLLLERGVSMGNEFDLDANPLARSAKMRNEKVLKLLLPHASYHSKYLAILSSNDQLCAFYSHKEEGYDHDDDDIKVLRGLQNMVLESLTEQECQQIRKLYFQDEYNNYPGKKFIAENLLSNELKNARQTTHFRLAKNIVYCFGDSDMLEKEKTWKIKPAHLSLYSTDRKAITDLSGNHLPIEKWIPDCYPFS